MAVIELKDQSAEKFAGNDIKVRIINQKSKIFILYFLQIIGNSCIIISSFTISRLEKVEATFWFQWHTF